MNNERKAIRFNDETEARGLKIFEELKKQLERMDVIVEGPIFATNPRKKGNMGMKCMLSGGSDEGWLVIRRNFDVWEIVPPLFKDKERKHYTNKSEDRDLCIILNRLAHEYVIDNKEVLLNYNNELTYNMDDLLQQLQLISRNAFKFNNIEILRSSFHKDFIEIDVRCRNKNSLLDEDEWNIDFLVPIIITKNEKIHERKKRGWVCNMFSNDEDMYMLIDKKNLKTFNRVLKDTLFKGIYEFTTKTNLRESNKDYLCEGNYR